MRTTWRFFPLGMAFAVLAAACGGTTKTSVDGSASPTSVYAENLAPCTNEATVEAVDSASATQLALPDETREASLDRRWYYWPDDDIQCRLRRALLTLEDLPSAWAYSRSSQRFDPVFDDTAQAPCGLPIPDAVAGLGVQFEPADSEKYEIVWHNVALLEPGRAEKLMAALRRTCTERSGDDEDVSSAFNYIVSEAEGLGDDALKIEEWYGERGTLSIWHVIERRGDLVSDLTVGSEDEAIDPLELAKTVSERIPDIGPIPQPTPYPGAGCGPGESPDEALEQDQSLARGLVSIEDLEPGWVEDPPSPCGFVAGEGFCEREDVDYPEPRAFAGTAFLHGWSAGSYGFSTRIESYSGSDAKKLLGMIAERNQESNSCEALVDEDSFTWNFEPIPSLSLGDESESWIVTTKGYPGQQEIWLFVSWIRRADHVAVLVYFTGGFDFLGSGAREFELERFQELAQVIDKKFATLDD